MSDVEFGDIEEDDVFSEGGEIAPEQVSHRLHELREELQELANDALKSWQELSDEEQQVAYDIGVAIVEQIVDDPDAQHIARWTHELRESIDQRVPPWNSLDDDEREVAQALIILILDWLTREGTVQS